MAGDHVIHQFTLEGRTFEIRVHGRTVALQDTASGREVELSVDETNALLRPRRSYERSLALHGVPLGSGHPDAVGVEAQLQILRDGLQPDRLEILLDTTTVNNAFACLDRHVVNPLTLLDLAIVSFAAVCFDRIVVQRYFASDHLRQNADIFHVVDYPQDLIAGPLWTLCAELFNADDEEIREMSRAWSQFLRLPASKVELSLRAADHYQDSPYEWNGVVAGVFHGDLMNTGFAALDEHELRLFLSVQTMRVLYNDRFAALMGLPYLASSFRAPVHSSVIARKLEGRLLVDQLLTAVGPAVVDAGSLNRNSPYHRPCSAPFILAVLLEEMSSPADYWQSLRKHRQRFAPLREKLARDRKESEGRSSWYLRRYEKYLEDVSAEADAGQILDASISVAQTAASALPANAGLVSAGIKALRLILPADKARRLFLRLFRPEVYLLLDLNHEAQSLRSVESQIRRIWGQEWSRAEQEQLVALTEASPSQFVRLRDLS